jgi:hypothetical protein
MSGARPVARAGAAALFALLPLAALAAGAGCGAAEKAAAKDPVRCERDPSCAKGKEVYTDCSKQCVDDPECIDRCRSVQTDRVGHP